jgi:membrane protein implicated in regulation of membrane protease activity
MAPRIRYSIAAIVIALILLAAGIPWYVPVILIAIAVAVPAIAYANLTPEQRRRLRRARGRKQIGS